MKTSIIFLGVCLFFIWPVLIWHNDVVFDKPTFVNRWLSVVGSGIVIAFIFNISYRKYADYVEIKKEAKLMTGILGRLEKIETLLNERSNKDDIKLLWNWIKLDLNCFSSDSLKNKAMLISKLDEYVELESFFDKQLSSYPNDDIRDILGKLSSVRNKLSCI